jgi:hypothetical protein
MSEESQPKPPIENLGEVYRFSPYADEATPGRLTSEGQRTRFLFWTLAILFGAKLVWPALGWECWHLIAGMVINQASYNISRGLAKQG